MSSIYDKRSNEFKGKNLAPTTEPIGVQEPIMIPETELQPQPETNPVRMPYKEMVKAEHPTDISGYENNANKALTLVDDVVLKNYLSRLSDLEIVPVSDEMSLKETILFKVNKMVYEKDEYATDKFISIISAMTYTKGSIFMIVDGHKDHTDI